MSDRSELQEFGKRLVQLVRDQAIQECDRLAAGQMRGPMGERWRTVLASDSAAQAVHALIPDIVDETLFRLLDAIDNDRLPLGWRQADGPWMSLQDLGGGEMAGWYTMGEDGWIASSSTQRSVDDLAGLTLHLSEDDPDGA